MRLLIQRVTEASVTVKDEIVAEINSGLLILCGVEEGDTVEDIQWCATKLLQLRIFTDDDGKMNLDVNQVQGSLLIVSQFTLHASVKKGNRPSFTRAAKPDFAEKFFNAFVLQLKQQFTGEIKTGIFGADMKVALVNDGPVTIWMDSKCRDQFCFARIKRDFRNSKIF
jgi:D-aminoacyl-tRNA deacylase